MRGPGLVASIAESATPDRDRDRVDLDLLLNALRHHGIDLAVCWVSDPPTGSKSTPGQLTVNHHNGSTLARLSGSSHCRITIGAGTNIGPSYALTL
jgi:hypothetical protein